MESKVCSSCGQNKLLGQFQRNCGTKDGRGACCKKCKAKEYKALSSENLDKRYVRELKRKYGLTLDDYAVLYSKQNKRCGICKTTKPGLKRNTSVLTTTIPPTKFEVCYVSHVTQVLAC